MSSVASSRPNESIRRTGHGPRHRALLFVTTVAALALFSAGCGDDSGLEDLIQDVEADQEPATTSTSSTTSTTTTSTTVADDSSDEPALTEDEQAIIDYLSDGSDVPEDEASCLVDGVSAEGLDGSEIIADTLSTDDEITLTDLILTCFEEPEILTRFVENVSTGFGDVAPFELETSEAECVVAALGDHDVTMADLDADEIPDALRDELNACLGLDPSGLFEPGDAYGDNPVLDRLWDQCEAGTLSSCDELYSISEIGSDYEVFGATCGEREEASAGGACDIPFTYGDNSELDAYWDACEAGDGIACDNLYFESPFGSEYETFGATCGYRYSEDSQSFCEDLLA